jgi:hypothetical protein
MKKGTLIAEKGYIEFEQSTDELFYFLEENKIVHKQGTQNERWKLLVFFKDNSSFSFKKLNDFLDTLIKKRDFEIDNFQNHTFDFSIKIGK